MPQTPPENRDSVKAMIIAAGFDEDAAERLISGPPPVARTPVPLVENKGKEAGPLLGGGGSTGRHTNTRGSVDGDR